MGGGRVGWVDEGGVSGRGGVGGGGWVVDGWVVEGVGWVEWDGWRGGVGWVEGWGGVGWVERWDGMGGGVGWDGWRRGVVDGGGWRKGQSVEGWIDGGGGRCSYPLLTCAVANHPSTASFITELVDDSGTPLCASLKAPRGLMMSAAALSSLEYVSSMLRKHGPITCGPTYKLQ